MKYRIVQADNVFYIQERVWLLFWRTVYNRLGIPSTHHSKAEAEQWLRQVTYEPTITIR